MLDLVFVFAGTHEQAEEWAHSRGRRRGEWRYIFDEDTIRGCRGFRYVCVGTWYEHPACYQIERELERAGATEEAT